MSAAGLDLFVGRCRFPGVFACHCRHPSPATGDIPAAAAVVPASAVPAGPSAPSAPPVQEPEALERDLAALFVKALNLEMAAADIDPAAPLFGDGLGLDSIDILEVALEVSHRYGFQLRSDDEKNQQIFQSLRSLAAHVAQLCTQ